MTNQELLTKIKELTLKINQEMFEGQLTLNFPILLSNSGKAAGSVHYSTVLGNLIYVTSLKISKNYNWTEQDLINVIAHELIHVWEIQILKKKPSHGSNFLNKMNQLNEKHKVLIVVKHNMKSTKQTKSRQVNYIVSEDKKRFVPVSFSVLLRLTPERLEKIFGPNFKIGKIDSDKIKSMSVSNRLRYTYKLTEAQIIDLGL